MACMNRADYLRQQSKNPTPAAAVASDGSTQAAGGGGGAGGKADDSEASKLKGGLSSAIVSEKPNVKWGDVAGLEVAKDALKEAVILPAKFPQLFVGKRKPWRGIMLYGVRWGGVSAWGGQRAGSAAPLCACSNLPARASRTAAEKWRCRCGKVGHGLGLR